MPHSHTEIYKKSDININVDQIEDQGTPMQKILFYTPIIVFEYFHILLY